jgi:dTDP-4-amino-4,6-dideoxygalactose transaminase
MPIEVDEEAFGMSRDDLYQKLHEYNVIARRYFYPIVPDFPCYRHIFRDADLGVARRVASRILVLPLYTELRIDEVERICDMLEYLHSRCYPDAAAAAMESIVSAPPLELVV